MSIKFYHELIARAKRQKRNNEYFDSILDIAVADLGLTTAEYISISNIIYDYIVEKATEC